MTMPSRIRVAIDRLVLHGVDPADKATVRHALIGEISARLAQADPSAIAGYAGRDRLQLAVGATQDAASLGKAAGGAIVDALSGGGRNNAP